MVLVIKPTKAHVISTFVVPNRCAIECFFKDIADCMSGSGCGCATLKVDGEAAIFALQEALDIARKSDAILNHSPK